MKSYAVAYLDLLGFGDFATLDTPAATELLVAYQAQVDLKSQSHRMTTNTPQKWQTVVDKWGVDSFYYYIPFSDSVFILSENPDRLLLQICNFILDSYLYHARQAGTSNPQKPEMVEETHFTSDASGGFQANLVACRRFPILFRGGISFGPAIVARQGTIAEGRLEGANLTPIGPAVVKAVRLEQEAGHGPFLLCDDDFLAQITGPFKQFVVPNQSAHSILYPAIHYFGEPDHQVALNMLPELFDPAARYWKAYCHEPYGLHYFEFLRLITTATVRYFSSVGMGADAEKAIKGAASHMKISDKVTHLLP